MNVELMGGDTRYYELKDNAKRCEFSLFSHISEPV